MLTYHDGVSFVLMDRSRLGAGNEENKKNQKNGKRENEASCKMHGLFLFTCCG